MKLKRTVLEQPGRIQSRLGQVNIVMQNLLQLSYAIEFESEEDSFLKAFLLGLEQIRLELEMHSEIECLQNTRKLESRGIPPVQKI